MNSQRKSRWTRRCRMRLSGSTGRNLMWSKRGKFSRLQWRERKFEFFLLLAEIAHVQGLSSERHTGFEWKMLVHGKNSQNNLIICYSFSSPFFNSERELEIFFTLGKFAKLFSEIFSLSLLSRVESWTRTEGKTLRVLASFSFFVTQRNHKRK